MSYIKSKLTVFFEEPFWVGLYERQDNGRYEVCKIVFGPEPKTNEIYQYLLENWNKLKFSPPIQAESTEDRPKNPKRIQREAKKAILSCYAGSKSQQALQFQREKEKTESKAHFKAYKNAKIERKYVLRQEKHKAKHRGH